MKLTKRLQAIADLVNKGAIVADIGSDHGYLVANLVENHIVDKAIASDINEGPVQNCNTTVETRGLDKSIEVRLGGGFTPYKAGEVDTAIIAGMGGQLIKDIIIESRDIADSVDTLILQPMTGQDVLRKWLIDNGYNIEVELVVNEQKRFYEILVVNKNNTDKLNYEEANEIYLEIGFKVDAKRSNYKGFLEKKISKYEMIVRQIKESKDSNDASLERMNIALKKLDKINEVMSCIPM